MTEKDIRIAQAREIVQLADEVSKMAAAFADKEKELKKLLDDSLTPQPDHAVGDRVRDGHWDFKVRDIHFVDGEWRYRSTSGSVFAYRGRELVRVEERRGGRGY